MGNGKFQPHMAPKLLTNIIVVRKTIVEYNILIFKMVAIYHFEFLKV